jgi:hypothetical protein
MCLIVGEIVKHPLTITYARRGTGDATLIRMAADSAHLMEDRRLTYHQDQGQREVFEARGVCSEQRGPGRPQQEPASRRHAGAFWCMLSDTLLRCAGTARKEYTPNLEGTHGTASYRSKVWPFDTKSTLLRQQCSPRVLPMTPGPQATSRVSACQAKKTICPGGERRCLCPQWRTDPNPNPAVSSGADPYHYTDGAVHCVQLLIAIHSSG